MKYSIRSYLFLWIDPGSFFMACFLYFAIFNKYLLAYQEQLQLFRFDWYYFTGFLAKPGGFTDYIGAFFIQFYYFPLAGAFVVTLAIISVYYLTTYILQKTNIHSKLWPYIPALLLLILQSDYVFNFGYSLKLIVILTFISIYLNINHVSLRYSFGFISWPILYIVTGGFSLLAIAIYIIYELLFTNISCRFYVVPVFTLMALLFPYFALQTVFYIPDSEVWLDPGFYTFREITKLSLLLFFIYLPLLLIGLKIIPGNFRKTLTQNGWNKYTIITGIIVLGLFATGIKKYVNKPEIKLFLEIDHNVQQAKWDQVLELSSRFKEPNRMTLYYTNLALYKTGHLGDRMFYYNQIGVPGLWLNRDKDEISLFLGGEIFYHLGNINEACRWAFDAMIANGQACPRQMKQLVLTSIINGDFAIAEKYLTILEQSLFYKKWAKHYRKYLNDSDLLSSDPEITIKRHLLINSDFVASSNDSDIGLIQLLENHPDNRMAFEYYMSSLLLDKNLIDFTANIDRIKNFGYKNIPVHYEEALLVYMGYTKKNVVPHGYGIRKTTVQRFRAYAKDYSTRSGSPETAAQFFHKSYGNTYWFYLHFIDNQASSNESNHPFN